MGGLKRTPILKTATTAYLNAKKWNAGYGFWRLMLRIRWQPTTNRALERNFKIFSSGGKDVPQAFPLTAS